MRRKIARTWPSKSPASVGPSTAIAVSFVVTAAGSAEIPSMPASQTIRPPRVLTAGEKARASSQSPSR